MGLVRECLDSQLRSSTLEPMNVKFIINMHITEFV